MAKKNTVLLTFDVEEFDLPLEYGHKIDKQEQLEISSIGLKRVLSLLKEYNIKSTFFTTAHFAEKNHELINQIVLDNHELASHMYYHSDYNEEHIYESKIKLEELSKAEVSGIRIPRLKYINRQKIKEAGYLYDSSINPIYLPGRYNNLNQPRLLHTDAKADLIIFPFSTGIFRIPLFWLSFKNMSLWFYTFLCKNALMGDGYLHLYFHPWEFVDITSYKIPFYIRRNSGDKMEQRFRYLLDKLKSEDVRFVRVVDFITTWGM